MKIGYFGAGAWGFALASILAANGHEVVLWTEKPEFAARLRKTKSHPKLPKTPHYEALTFTSDLTEALQGADILVESVTTKGLRPVLTKLLAIKDAIKVPFVITSKGIEQGSGLLLPEIALELCGTQNSSLIACLSGPSLADEVVHKLPTAVVVASQSKEVAFTVCDLFSSSYFRVYPNQDVNGVAFGGAMKNIIAIACGISDGLGFGANTKAALMTRGLHEMVKLSTTKECLRETLHGLSGLGDLCATCLSPLSRNYQFGFQIAQGLSPEEAKEKIGMTVEGTYTCAAALELARRHNIQVPITEAVERVIYGNLSPKDAVRALLQRAIKEEHL